MKTKLGLTILSAACIGLASCMGLDRDDQAGNRAADAKRVTFIEQTAPLLAKTGAEGFPIDPGMNQDEILAKNLEKIGCPKLARLFRDMTKFQGTPDKPLPTSFTDYLSCFGISGSGTLDDIDVVWEKFDDPVALLDCICGGDGLSSLFNEYGTWSVFSAQASAAAGAAFNASQSSAAGSAFDASQSSAAGSAFEGSQSNAAGQPFNASN